MEIFLCRVPSHTDDINSLFLCIPWWIRLAAACCFVGASKSNECRSGISFAHFSEGRRLPRAGGRWSRVCSLCPEPLDWSVEQVSSLSWSPISVLTFIFWVFWSSFSCLWTRNKSCQEKKRNKTRQTNKWVLKLMQNFGAVCLFIRVDCSNRKTH